MVSPSNQNGTNGWQRLNTTEFHPTDEVGDNRTTTIANVREELIRANSDHRDVINGIAIEIRAVRAQIIEAHNAEAADDSIITVTARTVAAVTIATLKSARANPVFTAVGGLVGGAVGAAAGFTISVGIGVGTVAVLSSGLGGALGGNAIDSIVGNSDAENVANAAARAMATTTIAGSILVGGALGATLVDSVGGGGIFSALGGVLGGAVGNGVSRTGVGCVRRVLAYTNSSITVGGALGGGVIGSAIGGTMGAVGSSVSVIGGTVSAAGSGALCGAIGGAIGGASNGVCITSHGMAALADATDTVDAANAGAVITTNAATHTSALNTLSDYSAANNRAVLADLFSRTIRNLSTDPFTIEAAEAVANIAANMASSADNVYPLEIRARINARADATHNSADAIAQTIHESLVEVRSGIHAAAADAAADAADAAADVSMGAGAGAGAGAGVSAESIVDQK